MRVDLEVERGSSPGGGRLVAKGTVDELRGPGGLLLRAEPVEEAARISERLAGVEAVEVPDDGHEDSARGAPVRRGRGPLAR